MKIASILCLLGTLMINNSAVVASASRYTQVAKIDTTDPLDDLLQDSEFKTYYDLGSYNYRTDVLNVDCELLRLYEYNYDDNYNNDFSLYVYIFNPLEDREFFTTDMRNNLQFSLKEYDENYKKYNLEFISKHENRFFKFKVSLDNNLYNKLDPSERTYNVSGFELVTVGNSNATDYPVDKSFIFTGSSDDNNLECNVTGLETIHLDVNGGYYRTPGLNENGNQTDIFYVYFSIPDVYLDTYGDLVKIHCSFYEYLVDRWFFVLDKNYLDHSLQNDPGSKGYSTNLLYSDFNAQSILELIWGGNYFPYNPDFMEASDISIDSATLKSLVERNGIDKFSTTSSIDAFRELNIGNFDDDGTDNRYDILSYEDTHSGWDNFWFKLLTGYETSFDPIVNLPVIENITNYKNYSDLYLSEDQNVINKYILENTLKFESTFVFRFLQKDYVSKPFGIIKETPLIERHLLEIGYCAKPTVILNFDIIDLTFEKNGKQSIIPVIADPIDIYTDITIKT